MLTDSSAVGAAAVALESGGLIAFVQDVSAHCGVGSYCAAQTVPMQAKQSGASSSGDAAASAHCNQDELLVAAFVGEGATTPIASSLGFAAAKANPELLMQLVADLGHWELADADEVAVTYGGENGDACMLTMQMVRDALASATPGAGGRRTLRVNIRPAAKGKGTFARPGFLGQTSGVHLEDQVEKLPEVRTTLEDIQKASVEKDAEIHDLQEKLLDEVQQADKQMRIFKEEANVQEQRAALRLAAAKEQIEKSEKQLAWQVEQTAAAERAELLEAARQEVLAKQQEQAQHGKDEAENRAESAEKKCEEQAAEFSTLIEQLKGQLASADVDAKVEDIQKASAEKDEAIQELQERLMDEVQQADEQMRIFNEEANVQEQRAALRLVAAKVQTEKFEKQLAAQVEQTAAAKHVAGLEAARQEVLAKQQEQAQHGKDEAEKRAESAEKKCEEQAAEFSSSIEQLKGQLASAKEEAVDDAERAKQAATAEEERLRSELAAGSARMLQEVEDAEKEALIAQEAERSALSGRVLSSNPEMAGVEEHTDDDTARGDVSKELADQLGRLGCRQAFRIGRVQLHAASKGEPMHAQRFPVCYEVVLRNDGRHPWPMTAALVHESGDAMGLPLQAIGSLGPGVLAKLEVDLRVPHSGEPQETTSTSMWVLRDAATGKPLGPALIFEVEWTIDAAV